MEKNNELFPFVHKHPLNPYGKLEGKCCVCEKIEPNEVCYICKECNFYFCKGCSKHAEKDEMLKLHRHLLKPTQSFFWSCDLCRSATYSSGMSMKCRECDFDVCVNCFWGLNNKAEKVY